MVTTSNANALTFCPVEGAPFQVQARTNTDAQPLNPATSNATTKLVIHERLIIGIVQLAVLDRPIIVRRILSNTRVSADASFRTGVTSGISG